MARALSDDLRVRVLEAGAAGGSLRSLAKRLGIGVSTAIPRLRRERESGERAARRQGKPRGSKLDGYEVFIVGMIEAQEDITLNEMVARRKDEQSVGIGCSTLSLWLRQRGWAFKKRPHMHWSRSAKISRNVGRTGSTASQASIRSAWSSSTKPASPRRWPVCVVALYAKNAVGQAFLMAIGKPPLSPRACASRV